MKYLGVDFGLRRIGLAVSEGQIASPKEIIEVKNIPDAALKIAKLIRKEGFEKIIVGLPEGKMAENVRGFVRALSKEGFDIETTEETLSSKKGLKLMIEQGISKKKRQHEDAYSAAEILQNFLDSK